MCKRLHKQYSDLFHPLYAIDEGSWLLLATIIQDNHVASVIEFGSGLSTLLMDKIGVCVTAIEDSPQYVPKFDLDYSVIIPWTGLDCLKQTDLIFIDGPGSPSEREISFRLAVYNNTSLIVCHDVSRYSVEDCIKKYLRGYKIIGKIGVESGDLAIAFMKKEN